MNIKLTPLARAYGALSRFGPLLAVLALAFLLPHRPDSLVALGVGFAGAIIDLDLQFASAAALSTAATGLAVIGSNIDMTVARGVSNGRNMYLVITVTTAITSGGAATVSFILASDSQDPIASDGTATVHYQSAAIPKATLVAGYQLVIPLPLQSPAYERYLGLLQNVGTAALTAGAITAELTFDPPGPAPTYAQSANIA